MAYYCLHEFHWTPSYYMNLSREEKAFILAAVQIKAENDKKEEKKMKSKSHKKH